MQVKTKKKTKCMQIHLMFEQLSQSFASCLSCHGRDQLLAWSHNRDRDQDFNFGSHEIETDTETFKLSLARPRHF